LNMCGIAGILNFNGEPDAATVEKMVAALIHRGPDHQAVVRQSSICLGHTRLAIIDPDPSSNQPLCLEDAGLWIVFNGEIYNFRDLRKELESHGAVFQTNGDTEVILHAYAKWGLDCFEKFNGMFALAIWDEHKRRLVLARDRAGKKPLFFQRLGDGGIAFASELKALRLHPDVSATVNPLALGHFLSLNYTLTDQCILAGVEKLPPAHYLVLDQGAAPKIEEYWEYSSFFQQKRHFRNEDEAAEELRALIDDAVRLRLVSDVPLGAFLSGGLDSASIVGAMATLQPAAQTKTFSTGFAEKTFNELSEAGDLASSFGVDHHGKIVDADMVGILPLLVKMADEPFADTSMIPFYYLSQHAREAVTVCLSGDGGDEMFAGYETYVADRLHYALGWVPPAVAAGLVAVVDGILPVSFDKVSFDFKLRRFLGGLGHSMRRAHYSWREIFSDEERTRLLRPEVIEAVSKRSAFEIFERHFDRVADCHYIDQALYVDAKTFMVDDILVKVDRASMAHSLEVRAPLLDYRVMEFAASLPVEYKLNGLRKKSVLKTSQAGRLPNAVLGRKKSGFNAPVSQWFNGPLGEQVREWTSNRKMAEWFDLTYIDGLWHQHHSRRKDNGLQLLGLASLGLWLENS